MEQTKTQLTEDLKLLRIERRTPSPAKTGRRNRALAAVVVVAAVALAWVLATRVSLNIPLGLTARKVQVAVAARRGAGEAQPVLSAGGYIVALRQVEVGSKITGRVVAFNVDEGERVTQGQVIARLDDSEFAAQVSKARASVAAARAHLAQLQAGSRPQEIGRARAEVERAKADMQNAELALRRSEQLAKEGVIAQQELDDARARFAMARSTYRATQESQDLTQSGPRPEEVELARARVGEAEADLALAQAQFQNTIIQAPITGTIVNRYVDLGAMVTTGFTSDRGAKQALVSIADMNDLQVELDITEADIAKVELEQPAVITPDVYPSRHYRGVLERIAPAANRQKAALQVKVKVLDPDEYLRSNMGAKVTFYQKGTNSAQQQPPAVTVPKAAVVRQDGRAFVFVLKDGKAVAQPVTLGTEAADSVQVVGGLQGGESVIVSDPQTLKDGEAVAAP